MQCSRAIYGVRSSPLLFFFVAVGFGLQSMGLTVDDVRVEYLA
jgi:hypothetical protein